MEAAPDCRACGACCVEAGAVPVQPDERTVPRYLTQSVRGRMGFASFEAEDGIRQMDKHVGGRCKALRGVVGAECRCAIYDRRPAVCRQFEPGSEGCLAARERMVWKLSRMEWRPHGYGEDWARGVPADYRPGGLPVYVAPET